jgi:hypothetical protein
MYRVGGVLAVLAALVAAGATGVEAHRAYRAQRAPAADHLGAPVKDCTRFNGRWGYYGNPWCSPAEQDRFDRWSAARRPWR